MISVIVPVYNAEHSLYRCIDSILHQSFTDFELLLIDDGSSDKSGEICDEYACNDSRIKVFHKANGGVGSARNLGLDYAQGNWIAFCDADDYVASNWLALFVDQCSFDVQMAVQGLCFIDYKSKEKKWAGCDIIGSSSECLLKWAEHNVIGYTVVKLFSKSILSKHKIRFNEKFYFREDEDFVLRYLKYIDRISCTKQGAYFYEMPDLSTKYLWVDNFYTSLSMFKSIQTIYPLKDNDLYRNYLRELTNAFWVSYNLPITFSEKRQRLISYKSLVGDELITVSGVSGLTKRIYSMNNLCATIFYIIKGYIFSIYNKVLRRV